MKKKWILLAPVAITLFVFLGGEAVLHLWNWLVPTVIGWHTITFWQAVGILALCRILFGGLGGGGHRSKFRGRMGERWDKMTPEEREQFRQGMRGRCGMGTPSESKA